MQSGDDSMLFASTPAATNWRRLASTKSRKIFVGRVECPGARAVKKVRDTFRARGRTSLTSRNRAGSVLELRFKLVRTSSPTSQQQPPNARSNGGFEVAGAAAEVATHFAHAFFDDALHRAALRRA